LSSEERSAWTKSLKMAQFREIGLKAENQGADFLALQGQDG